MTAPQLPYQPTLPRRRPVTSIIHKQDTKVPATNPSHLTNGEKTTITDAITNNPQGTVITVSDDGTVTITYPDGSHDTILGTDVVTKTTDSSTTN